MSYYEKPFKDHRYSPPISIYLLSDDTPEMEPLNCLFCKRTIVDVKGTVDKIISTPMPLIDFGVAINIRCKLCHAHYRLLINMN